MKPDHLDAAAEDGHARLASRIEDESLIGVLHDAIIGTDSRWIVQHWNAAAEALYGWSAEEAIGSPVSELLGGGWQPDERQHAMEALLRDGVWRGAVVQHHRTGAVLHVQATVSALRDTEGRVSGAISVNRDITDLKRLAAEVSLHEQQWWAVDDLLSTVREASAVMLTARDREVLMDGVCTRLLRHDGVESVILLDHRTRESGPPLVHLHSAGLDDEAKERLGAVESGLLPVCYAHGEKAPPRLLEAPKSTCDGCPFGQAVPGSKTACYHVGHRNRGHQVLTLIGDTGAPPKQERALMCGMVDDLSLALHAIHERERERGAERDRERLLNLSQDLICVAGGNGYLKYANPAWETSLGHSAGELLSRPFLDFIHPDDHAASLCEMASVLQGSPARGFETRCVTKCGEARSFSWTATAVPEEHLIFCIGRDVTERKGMEVELAHARKLEAVGQLASGIAHEINTPAQFVGDNVRFVKTASAGLLDMIAIYRKALDELIEGSSDASVAKDLRRAEEKAKLGYITDELPAALEACFEGIGRISSIVGAMKGFAHPGQDEQQLEDVNHALQITLTIARNEYKYVADIETDLAPLPAIMCHLGDLNQVFLNLIVNAAHAISDVVRNDDERGTISIRTRRDGDHVMVDVGDTGTGIPEKVQSRIFDPFFTTKEVGRGTGQGLPICRSIIVDKHRGSLAFETEKGKGTTFRIRLPIDARH